MERDRDDYVARHSTVGSGAAGRATDGEIDEELEAERAAARTPPDDTGPEMPDPDGSRHEL